METQSGRCWRDTRLYFFLLFLSLTGTTALNFPPPRVNQHFLAAKIRGGNPLRHQLPSSISIFKIFTICLGARPPRGGPSLDTRPTLYHLPPNLLNLNPTLHLKPRAWPLPRRLRDKTHLTVKIMPQHPASKSTETRGTNFHAFGISEGRQARNIHE